MNIHAFCLQISKSECPQKRASDRARDVPACPHLVRGEAARQLRTQLSPQHFPLTEVAGEE
eukprot:scaffold498283_cov36-Prasinocladus_malaysianus.AAC.1